jgi:adenine-specific DNA-methyltransferase
MRYFGSKASTVTPVVELAMADMKISSVADAFGGLGTIGAEFRRKGLHVTTCDLLRMPHAFQVTKISCASTPRYLAVRKRLNLPTRSAVAEYLNTRCNTRSWLVKEFSQERQFFLPENAARIAGAWDAIRRWEHEGLLSNIEKNHLLASFINGVDACANTAGTYYAFLKQWDRKAKRDFRLQFIEVPTSQPKGVVLQGDALESLRGKSFDLLYLDPPYNGRDYARYYHLPESLAKLSRPKTNPDSMSGQPLGLTSTSSKFRAALRLPYLENLVQSVGWKRLVVQYCDNAFIPLDDLRRMLGSVGKMREYTLDALTYTSKSQDRRIPHHVFVVDKSSRST